MKTFVTMHNEICNVVGKYFPDTCQMDTVFRYVDDYMRAILWSTYPELNLNEIEAIEELLIQDATAEEILQIMQLEDRDEKLQQTIQDMSELPRSRWRDYTKEQIMASRCRGYWGLSNAAEATLVGDSSTIREDSMDYSKAVDKLEELRAQQ